MMGWGCYKHEWDATSENWDKYLQALCDRKLEENPRTFGRDSEICPKCFIELESKISALQALVDEAEKTLEDISRGEISSQYKSRKFEDALKKCAKAALAKIQEARRGE